jgi:hypothetical protein
MKTLILTLAIFISNSILAQPTYYSVANAHSHNDYEQQAPFYNAYNEEFGSIEADIHLINGNLLVGHDKADLSPEKTLENLYLIPLKDSKIQNRSLQLLIDIKTEASATLDSLVSVLKKYPSIINNESIKIIITGNRPDESLYITYPTFILFDGRMNKTYTKEQLSKIGLISDSYESFITNNTSWPIIPADKEKIDLAIQKVHALHKPARLWATPDFSDAWEEMIKLKIDFINTDHINELADFFITRDTSKKLLPYNRIIKSAGTVIRFGDPSLENHALDVAAIEGDRIAIVEERFGLTAIDVEKKEILSRLAYAALPNFKSYISTYSGIKTFKYNQKTWIVWSAVNEDNNKSALLFAEWNNGFIDAGAIPFHHIQPAKNAIPNEVEVAIEDNKTMLYVVLNGNNQLVKIDWESKQPIWFTKTGVAPYGLAIANNNIYVSNWAGETATKSSRERAGVPWGLAYTDPKTGATAGGSVSVFNKINGRKITEIKVGLHPNVIKASKNELFVFVANGSSDEISVINTLKNTISESIQVGLFKDKKIYQGSTPNGLFVSQDNTKLYVSNGLDNAVAVVKLGLHASPFGKGKSYIEGYIPTEAYPAGLTIVNNKIVVANLESDGSNVIDKNTHAREIHNQLASVSIINLPDPTTLGDYSREVLTLSLINRTDQLSLPPRPNINPIPVPARMGEPSVFKHVVYIIKENKTYDQVLGDMKMGNGDASLCVFGENITPNTHALAAQFGWMDNFYASGKSSAEGHQWTDAGMVSDYVEKNVRAWLRSYPHRQEDALVYNKAGFIWNQALDHGKTVKIYGEACETIYDKKLTWADFYRKYKDSSAIDWYNKTTIARIRPIISNTYPDCDNIAFLDQQRADIFINDWKKFEQDDNLPNLMILSLPNDHSAGTSPQFPTPDAMVADNDLAVGRIVETISKSKYWDSTVIFITQDDSQSGWDHVSSYRTIGLVVSPYSSGKLNSSNYNQTSILRTIEQILGIPPMNVMDATARPMIDCFQQNINRTAYRSRINNIPLNKMNKPLQTLTGKARKYAIESQEEVFNEVDGGEDDKMNRIIWFYSKGNEKYPDIK